MRLLVFVLPQWLDERPVLPAEKGHTAASVTKEVTKKLRCAAGNSRRPYVSVGIVPTWIGRYAEAEYQTRSRRGAAGLSKDRLGYASIENRLGRESLVDALA